MHCPGSAGKQRDEVAALRFVQAVGVNEDAQPMAGVIALPVWVGRERDEAVRGVGEVPEPGPGRGDIPVDEGPLRVVDDEVPGGQVVVGNDVGALGGDQGLPPCVWRWSEVGDGVMEVADELRDVDKLSVGFEQGEVVWPGDAPGMKLRTSRPCSSRPRGRGAPRKPTACRWASSAWTAGVQGPVGRRTVSPTRTTPLLMFPPDSGISSLPISHSLAACRVAEWADVDGTGELLGRSWSTSRHSFHVQPVAAPLAALVRLPPASSSEPPSRAAGAGVSSCSHCDRMCATMGATLGNCKGR